MTKSKSARMKSTVPLIHVPAQGARDRRARLFGAGWGPRLMVWTLRFETLRQAPRQEILAQTAAGGRRAPEGSASGGSALAREPQVDGHAPRDPAPRAVGRRLHSQRMDPQGRRRRAHARPR